MIFNKNESPFDGNMIVQKIQDEIVVSATEISSETTGKDEQKPAAQRFLHLPLLCRTPLEHTRTL